MDNIITKDFRISNADERWNTLSVGIYYSLGGMNYFTYKNEPRGYYFSITPEVVSGCMRSYTAFTGFKTCFKEVKRKTKKQNKFAERQFEELCKKYVPMFCERYGIELDE